MRIAFAEDDRQLRASVARGLREAGYEVDLASNGPDAVALLRAGTHDALILDLLLPGLGGLDVCRRLRAEGIRVPILMLTALDAIEDRIAGLDAGADDYLTKPFAFGELLARLRALTRRHGETDQQPVALGDLALDPARRRALARGEEIALTGREFECLLYLVRHAGRVVSRAELLAEVWGDERASYSNIIDVYASRLRKKLEGVTTLTTVRGAGFVLEAVTPPPRARRR